MGLELALICLATAAALMPVVRARRVLGPWAPTLVIIAVLMAAGLGGLHDAHRDARAASTEALLAATPGTRDLRQRPRDAYVGSATCRSCHPSEYHSWHESYHRTMTTLAGPGTVKARFDDVTMENRGRTYRMERRGDEYWVAFADPDFDWSTQSNVRTGAGPVVEKRVVMVTGSHDTQIFWVSGEGGNRLNFFPLGWKIPTQEWIPVQDLFLRGPESDEYLTLWNYSCIQCHATGPLSRPDNFSGGNLVAMDTQVAELGIACEACHGPGGAHTERHRSPLERWSARGDDEHDPTIVNPANLPRERQSDVCGQCHGISLFRKKQQEIWQTGFAFRPGDEIDDVRGFLSPRRKPFAKYIAHQESKDSLYLENHFWSDGQVRVSGRDYSSMIDSACSTEGQISCLDCHSLHDADPNDQLKTWGQPHEACTQCHQAVAGDIEGHTHHSAASSGSDCYGCHMPHTTYGLLKAIRSHTITSPTVAETAQHGRPNACNLCHLDQTLDWTRTQLVRWYGGEEPELTGDDAEVPVGARMMLSGDAAQRAIVAWNAGRDVTRQLAGVKALAPYLAHLLDDPFPAVRYVAEQSLRAMDIDLGDYHHLDGPSERGAAVARIKAQLTPSLDPATVKRLAAKRDDTPLDLRE